MSKCLIIVAALLLVSGIAFAGYDEGSYVNNKELSKGSAADPVRVYQLVRYAEMADASRYLSGGEAVAWDCVSDDGVTIGLVGTVGSADAFAGITVGAIPSAEGHGTAATDINKRNWGYIQTYGPCSSAMVKATVAVAGQSLKASDTASYLDIDQITMVASAVITGPVNVGFAYDTVSTNAEDVEVFIKNR